MAKELVMVASGIKSLNEVVGDGGGDTSGGREGVGLLTVGGVESELGLNKLPIVLVSTSSTTATSHCQLGIPTECESHPLLSW